MTTRAGQDGEVKHSLDTGACFLLAAQKSGGWHTLPAEGDEIEIIVNIRRQAQQGG